MRHRVSMRQIESFLLAGELLSFRRAAERMHITQSAFSQLIRELEASLGVRLLERTTRKVQLTAAGEAMHQKMRRSLDTIDEACEEAQAVARVARGHIRVGTLASLAVGVVTRTLTRLRRDFPGVTVSMREDFNDALVDLVVEGQTDLTVCSEIKVAPGLEFQFLFEDELVLVTRPDTRVARLDTVPWSLLADEPLVFTARRTATRQHVASALSAHGIARSADFEVASTPTALAMVRAGFGSAFVSGVALDELDINGLKVVRLAAPPMRRIGLYRRIDHKPSPATLKFELLLREEVRRTVRRLAARSRRFISSAS